MKRWLSGFELRRITLYPASHHLVRLTTPWGFVELHVVPLAR